MFYDNIKTFLDRPALIETDGNIILYRQVYDAGCMIRDEIQGRALIFVLCSNTAGCVCSYIGTLKAGCVALLLSADIKKEHLEHLIDIYKPNYICCPASFHILGKEVGKIFDYSLYLLSHISLEINNSLACLLTTSGSTGSPKFVRLSYSNIEANTRSIIKYLEITDSDRPITTLPMNYTYGLSVINTHIAVGATIILTDIPVVRREFWDTLNRYEATSIAGVPYTYEVLNKIHMTEMYLPRLKVLTQAGGRLPTALHRIFAEYALNTGRRFVVMYGQTEATARMSYLPPSMASAKTGSIGIPIPGGKFYIEDSSGDRIDRPYVDGELIYMGDNVSMGYAECASDLNKSDEHGGVLHTGDIAHFDDEGYYYITGRLSRFVKMYGSRVNLNEIEDIITARFVGIDAAAVGRDGQITLYINDCKRMDEALRYIIHTTHLPASSCRCVFIDKIPRNQSGKILYSKLEV